MVPRPRHPDSDTTGIRGQIHGRASACSSTPKPQADDYVNNKVRGAMAAIQTLNGIAGLFVALPRLARSEGFNGTQIVLIAVIVLSMLGILAGFYSGVATALDYG